MQTGEEEQRTLPEYVPVMLLEFKIFQIFALGMQLLATGSFFTPVIFGLASFIHMVVSVTLLAVMLLKDDTVIVRDPDIAVLTDIARVLTKVENPKLDFTAKHLRQIAKAAFHLQVSFLVVYVLHVIVIWSIGSGAMDTPDDESNDFWLLLFRHDWGAVNPTGKNLLKLHVVVSIAVLATLLVIAYVIWHSFLAPLERKDEEKFKKANPSLTERWSPSTIWYQAVGISQIIQYTMYLNSFGKLEQNAYLFLAFVPWVADFIFNEIVAERLIRILQNRVSSGSRDIGLEVCFYVSRTLTPLYVWSFTLMRVFVFVHEAFWVINIFLCSILITVRVIECMRENKLVLNGIKFGARVTTAIDRRKVSLGVQQPRLFFKKRLGATRNKSE
jgi:hypothetical protein